MVVFCTYRMRWGADCDIHRGSAGLLYGAHPSKEGDIYSLSMTAYEVSLSPLRVIIADRIFTEFQPCCNTVDGIIIFCVATGDRQPLNQVSIIPLQMSSWMEGLFTLPRRWNNAQTLAAVAVAPPSNLSPAPFLVTSEGNYSRLYRTWPRLSR